MTELKLYGRVFINAEIEALSGLHIGGTGGDMDIGGVDKAVIRNPITRQPYVPGSSLRGKMRSQVEKITGAAQNTRVGQIRMHTCKTEADYNAKNGCAVCHVFGISGDDFSQPTRLIVRDASLTSDSVTALRNAQTDLAFVELKTEVAIDRVTSAASPRNMERVPAGSKFAVELVFSIYEAADINRLRTVVDALQLVEDDYLGGSGSRGSGKVQFKAINIALRNADNYSEKTTIGTYKTTDALGQAQNTLLAEIQTQLTAIPEAA